MREKDKGDAKIVRRREEECDDLIHITALYHKFDFHMFKYKTAAFA